MHLNGIDSNCLKVAILGSICYALRNPPEMRGGGKFVRIGNWIQSEAVIKMEGFGGGVGSAERSVHKDGSSTPYRGDMTLRSCQPLLCCPRQINAPNISFETMFNTSPFPGKTSLIDF